MNGCPAEDRDDWRDIPMQFTQNAKEEWRDA